jgi:hypothetical protein
MGDYSAAREYPSGGYAQAHADLQIQREAKNITDKYEAVRDDRAPPTSIPASVEETKVQRRSRILELSATLTGLVSIGAFVAGAAAGLWIILAEPSQTPATTPSPTYYYEYEAPLIPVI